MKLLVIHTWLRGNLGDVLQCSVLLRSLRELGPTALDLAGYPATPGEGARELVALADRHLPEPFAWHWRFAPAAARAMALEPHWRRQRAALFSRYDAIVSAPGPFLAEYDARSPSALADLDVAADLGIPLLLASHSIGPLPADSLRRVGRATLCVAREDRTFEYLRTHGLRAERSADLAFLFPYQSTLAESRVAPWVHGRYRLLFLRARNLPVGSVRWCADGLRCGSRVIGLDPGEQVVVATSDTPRDGRFVARLSRSLGVRAVECRSVAELVALIAGSTGVVSDRYHPAICAAVLGKPAELLSNHEPHKMLGLQGLLREHGLDALRDLARAGLGAVHAALPGSPRAEPRPTLA